MKQTRARPLARRDSDACRIASIRSERIRFVDSWQIQRLPRQIARPAEAIRINYYLTSRKRKKIDVSTKD
jgi:hypothetical protein